jgi:hypothetical protein
MKYLKKFQILNEAFINPISDFLTDFIDFYDCEITVTEIGVVDLQIKAKDEDAPKLLSLYQESIARIKDYGHIIKGNNYTYISFYEGGLCHIRIERIVKDKMTEYKFETPEQETAYKAIVKCIGNAKLEYSDDPTNKFDLVEGPYTRKNWIKILPLGIIKMPILRGSKSQEFLDLPFNDLDCEWFKRILFVNDNLYGNTQAKKEFTILHSKTQAELRELYK